tara:strand:+ start:1370 stop:1927 length:558 start_codon:yes stop_codon:yes gene_type:complete
LTQKSAEGKLQVILDRHEIHDLAMRYCRACDRMDESMMRSIFHENAYIEYGFFNGLAPEFVGWVIKHFKTHYVHSFHSISNEYVVLKGEEAFGELYAIIHSRIKIEDSVEDSIIGGRYLDDYERREGEWRIAHRRFVLDWVDSKLPQDEALLKPTNSELFFRGKMITTDLSYSVIPEEPKTTLDW